MTKKDIIEDLKNGVELSTSMLDPLGIPFDFWLTFVQYDDYKQNLFIKRLIERTEKDLEEDEYNRLGCGS